MTFPDEFDRPQLSDMYWFAAYRSGRKEYLQRTGQPSRWVDHNAHVVIESSILKLRIDETLPFRPDQSTACPLAATSTLPNSRLLAAPSSSCWPRTLRWRRVNCTASPSGPLLAWREWAASPTTGNRISTRGRAAPHGVRLRGRDGPLGPLPRDD
jgi:hypothetical protein